MTSQEAGYLKRGDKLELASRERVVVLENRGLTILLAHESGDVFQMKIEDMSSLSWAYPQEYFEQ